MPRPVHPAHLVHPCVSAPCPKNAKTHMQLMRDGGSHVSVATAAQALLHRIGHPRISYDPASQISLGIFTSGRRTTQIYGVIGPARVVHPGLRERKDNPRLRRRGCAGRCSAAQGSCGAAPYARSEDHVQEPRGGITSCRKDHRLVSVGV